MPRVNKVAKCRKSPGNCGKCGTRIETGQPYIYWAFMVGGRGGPKLIRCGKDQCRPKPSELTQSEFQGALLSLQESTEFDATNAADIEAQRDDVRDELQNLLDETQEKFNNLPEGLQNGQPGELQQGRIDALETGIQELEGVDIQEFDEEEPESDKKKEKWVEDRDAHYSQINQELKDALEAISAE